MTREQAFALLGIPETRDQAEIRKAWRALVRQYHPDLAKVDKKAANDRLVEINEAFDLLSAGFLDQAKQTSEEARRRARDAKERQRRAWEHAQQRAELRRQKKMARDAERQWAAEQDRMEREAAQADAMHAAPQVEDSTEDGIARRLEKNRILSAIRSFGISLRLMAPPAETAPKLDLRA